VSEIQKTQIIYS